MAELNITPDAGGDSQEYIDAMVKKAEGTPTTPEAPVTPERPAWLPEKFATPEDMAKAYAALEGKQSGKPNDDPNAAPAVQPEEATETAEKAVQSAGLDMDALGEKITANGDLDEADYEALQKVGISKDMVTSYVQGQKAVGEQMVGRLHETVGGADNFDSVISWAADNLPKADIDAFNKTVDTGSEQAIQMALRGIHSQYQSAGQQAPNLQSGGRAQASGGDVYRSTAELTKAMGDRRYQNDPAYRASVAEKLNRSNIL